MAIFFNQARFVERFRGLMENSTENTYTMAEYLHLTPPTISRYMSGENFPKPPTIKMIAEKFGVNFLWLSGADNQDKYIQVSHEPKQIPVLGTIAAGQPIIAEEQIEGYEYVSDISQANFCLKIKGDSMINARIHDGDIAFIRQQEDVENGEIAAVMVDDEATLKKVYKYPGTLILRAENPNYSEIVFDKKSSKNIRIIGKCIAVKYYTGDDR